MALATDTVMNTADSGAGSLRAVIAGANNGDTINFAPNLLNTTITLTSGPISTQQNLTIAAAPFQGITISGGNNSRIFYFSGASAVNETINNLTFTGGAAGTEFGGAIDINGGSLSLTGDTFNNNQADDGGAVYVNPFSGTNGTLSVTNCNFNSNTASGGSGGAIAVAYNNASDSVTLNNTGFTSNQSGQSGGAVEAAGQAGTTFTVNAGCSFTSKSLFHKWGFS